ncbi:hypothetical protein EI94DRAFT_1707796 [Lactarius quietus]|nr:hypothetical protein EI94DRAFT_1707796 [Lactarius quietus]
MAFELTQVELQFLAFAAKLFAAAMIFSAHPPDDGQQIYLDRKVKDEITSLETQFNAFMGDPMKVRKKPRIHPIIQIMAQEWRAAEAEQRMPNWGIFTLDYVSEHCNAQREAHTDWHLHLLTLYFTVYLQGIPDDRCWSITGLPPPQGDPDKMTDNLIGTGLTASELTQVEAQFLAIAARLFTAAMTFSAHPPDDGQQAYLVRKVKDEIEWKVAEAEQRMPDWGIFTLDHISGYCHAQREAHSDWHPDLSTLDLSRYLQGLQNHRRWWVTGLPPPQGDVDDMDSTPSAQGRASDTSLPRVQVDDASPPPPAQRRRLDVQPLVATGDYRCGTCKNPKVNNAECVSQINDNRLTYKCAFCAERRRPCAPAASWAQPIIHLMKFRNLDLPPGVEATYGPSAVGKSSISPGENLESRVNSLEAKMDYVILVLNALAGTQGIIPSSLPGYIQRHQLVDQLPPAITPYLPLDLPSHHWGLLTRHLSHSHVPVPGQIAQHNVGEAALRPLRTSEAEVLETPAARQPSSNEIVVSHRVYICTSLMIWRLAHCQGRKGASPAMQDEGRSVRHSNGPLFV